MIPQNFPSCESLVSPPVITVSATDNTVITTTSVPQQVLPVVPKSIRDKKQDKVPAVVARGRLRTVVQHYAGKLGFPSISVAIRLYDIVAEYVTILKRFCLLSRQQEAPLPTLPIHSLFPVSKQSLLELEHRLQTYKVSSYKIGHRLLPVLVPNIRKLLQTQNINALSYFLAAVGMAIFPQDEDVEYLGRGELRVGKTLIPQDFLN